jgi:hypothetical protein
MRTFTELQTVNQKLKLVIGQVSSRSSAPAITAGELRELVSILNRIGSWLHAKGDCPKMIGTEDDIHEYRENLECLHRALPAFHAWLLVERTRFERDRIHTQAASEWATCNKNIFDV